MTRTREEETLATILALLDRLDIPYMLTGSVAASCHVVAVNPTLDCAYVSTGPGSSAS